MFEIINESYNFSKYSTLIYNNKIFIIQRLKKSYVR